MLTLLLTSVGLLFYVYGGYPLVLQLIVWLRGPRRVAAADITPVVTLVISAYNEAAVIASKLENAIAIDYPVGKLQIVVISDASSDGTDDIVRSFAPRVELHAQPRRLGKTAGLNAVVPNLRGEIVVFSDANAMYDAAAIRMLVRNFADPKVGCVTGEARYAKGGRSAADAGERAYWGYEMWLKRLESSASSLVGGDGAIYAIRRALWTTLPENAINDFLNPLQIVGRGYRGVYEPTAICFEETAGAVGLEWRRRVRIVSRSWRAVFQAPGVLNPFRVGLFSFCLLSHKVLRWFSAVFLMVALGSLGVILLRSATWVTREALLSVIVLLLASMLFPAARRALALPVYFAAVTMASIVGLVKGSFGSVSGVWSTPRSRAASTRMLRPGLAVLFAAAVLFPAAILAIALGGPSVARLVFWSAVGVLAYIYAGYPLLVWVLSRTTDHHVHADTYQPSVCLLIAAFNEEPVIAEKIRNSQQLDYPDDRLEIVIASDGSTDRTVQIAGGFPGVRLLNYPVRRGKIATLNEAMRTISSDVVVFSDANTFLRRDAIRVLVRNLADERVGAVSGDVALTGVRASLAGSEDLYYRYERSLQRMESSIGSLIGVDGALYALRRTLFEPPPADTILDDMAIPMAVVRAGFRVVFDEDALAFEEGSSSAQEEFSRKSRVIAGAVQFLLRRDSALPVRPMQPLLTLVSHKALRWLSPAFAAVAFASSVVIAKGSLPFAMFVAAQLGLILAGAAGCVPALRRFGPIGLAHYLCLVQSAAAFGFVRGLLRRQPVAWRRFDRPGVQPS